MYNIIASFYPEKTERVLLCAHWDSRPIADSDPDSSQRNEPVPGANDGASGAALLLEIAQCIVMWKPPVGIDIALFDGEDGGTSGINESWCLGSRHFAQVMPETYRPRYAVVVDMIGDKDLTLSYDITSMKSAPWLWSKIRSKGESSALHFSPYITEIYDDHVPLIERGIPTVDIIDFEYPYWHTVSDTPDKCSPESLEKVGTLILSVIYGE